MLVKAGGGNPSARQCVKSLVDRWISWAGHPEIVATDGGTHFRGEFAQYLAQKSCLVWCALDHLHGKAVIYFNEELFSERAFKDAITKYKFEMTAKKGWGKGKAKMLNAAGDISGDEAMDPQGFFMEQIGMGKGQNAKGVKNGFTFGRVSVSFSQPVFGNG